jgi:protein-L-isoaspartate(D-aspartate) O-methyltransferase
MQDLSIKREHMIEIDLEARGIRDPAVLSAMRRVPREAFVPKDLHDEAYADNPLPIGKGQTISQPYIVALMTELARVGKDSVVLDVGTGSGYQAAILAEMCQKVYSIEIIPGLSEIALGHLDRLGYRNVYIRVGDGSKGWPEHAPYDAILVAAAPDHIPPALVEQLKTGGRLVVPVGAVAACQHLLLIQKHEDGNVTQEKIIPVRFVPLVCSDDDEGQDDDKKERT